MIGIHNPFLGTSLNLFLGFFHFTREILYVYLDNNRLEGSPWGVEYFKLGMVVGHWSPNCVKLIKNHL